MATVQHENDRPSVDVDALTDGELVERVRAHQMPSFDALFARHNPALFRYCLSLTRLPELAEEVCQEVWIAFWRTRKSFTLTTPTLLPWLLVVGRNKSMSSFRNRLNTVALHDEVTQIAAPTQSDPEHTVLASELEQSINRTIASLDPVDAAVYDLCVQQEVSYKRAATELGLSTGAVRSRLFRVRKTLKAIFMNWNEQHD